MEGLRCRTRYFNHLVEGYIFLRLLYLWGYGGGYIWGTERIVVIFDIGSLRSSLGQRWDTCNRVLYRICHFSWLRHTCRRFPLVSCLPVSEQVIGSWKSSYTSHGQWGPISPHCTSWYRLDRWCWRGWNLFRERVNMGREDVLQRHSWVRVNFCNISLILGMRWLWNDLETIFHPPVL